MSRPGVQELELSDSALELVKMAALGVGLVLHAEVVGFITNDQRGIAIVPKSGVGIDLFRALSKCDWESQVRMAEEWMP